jgi:hypothetical protein
MQCRTVIALSRANIRIYYSETYKTYTCEAFKLTYKCKTTDVVKEMSA